jgi:hypothetical protein
VVVGSDPCAWHETATTLPVDFHSFRRAFNTALAEAGINVQHAMHLAAHSDPKTHMRYVMRTAAMRTTPEAAPPHLVLVEAVNDDAATLPKVAPPPPRIVTGGDDSTVAGPGVRKGTSATPRGKLCSDCWTRTSLTTRIQVRIRSSHVRTTLRELT